MSQYYTLTDYKQVVDKSTGEPRKDQHGNVAVFAQFAGVRDSVYWKVKNLPQKGEQYYGHIEQGEYGGVFRRDALPEQQAGQRYQAAKTYQAAKRDNSDGMRQGMCINNAANYVIKIMEFSKNPLTKQEWAEQVWEYANALYAKGDLGQEPVKVVDLDVSGNEDIAQLLGQVE